MERETAALMSPGKKLNTCLWIFTLRSYSQSTLENIDENQLYVCSLNTKNLAKLSTLLRTLCSHQLLSAQ